MAACDESLFITPPQKHDIIHCAQKPNAALHLKKFDAAHRETNIRKQGDVLIAQFKFNGDWLLTPTRIQLVPHYLNQVRQFEGKLIFEDTHKATYKYYYKGNSYWLELSFIGEGIHIIKTVKQLGIIKDAEYNIAQIKSRIKRYGKVIFYEIESPESIRILGNFLKHDKRKFYLVSHMQHKNGDNFTKSQIIAKNIVNALFDAGAKPSNLIAKGIGHGVFINKY